MGKRGVPAPAEPENEAARLAVLHELDILDTLPEQAYDDIARLASHITGTPHGLITLVDADRQWFKARHQHDATQTPRAISFCAHAILVPTRTTIVEDATRDPRFADNPDVLHDPKIRFYAGAPLVTSRGEALGTLCVFDHVPRKMEPEKVAALEALARTVMELLDKRLMLRALGSALVALSRERREGDAMRTTARNVMREIAHVAAMQPATLGKVGERVGREIEGVSLRARLEAYFRLELGALRELERTPSGLRVFEGKSLVEVRPGARRSGCHFTEGFLRGVVGADEGLEMASEEVACASRGDASCRFVLRAAKTAPAPVVA